MFEVETKPVIVHAKPKKIFQAKKKISRIPKDILENIHLNEVVKSLPENYNFEVHKSIWRIQELNAKRVGLQMPEGLLMYAITLADIIEKFTEAEVIIFGDVTYGACCIDDFSASAMNIELLIHYGHSCLIPVDQIKSLNLLYVFVDIKIDCLHLRETVERNFHPNEGKIALVSTVQFVTTLQAVAKDLLKAGYSVVIPQVKPLSPGEILGCTAPHLQDDVKTLIYVGDGRFHLEAAMICNPEITAYKYNPYEKKITVESYDYSKMASIRKQQIDQVISSKKIGIILGTLGRQGSIKVLKLLENRINLKGYETIKILLSEIFPDKLNKLNDIDAFVQIACPRLSIDWGKYFTSPLLNPYEIAVVLSDAVWAPKNIKTGLTYPMDFYANDSLGPWTPNFSSPNIGFCENNSEGCCGRCIKAEYEKSSKNNGATENDKITTSA